MTLTAKALKRIGVTLPAPARSNFYLGGRDTLKDRFEQSGFTKIRRWYQPMMTDVTSGSEFCDMTLALRPELEELVGFERFDDFKRALSHCAQDVLDQGEGIGLDALVIIAHKK
jgi:hypothetical protein